MIRVEGITSSVFDNVSFEIRQPFVYKIIARSQYDQKILMDLLFGIKVPFSGSVYIFDKDINIIRKKELRKIFGRIGVVKREGGLISNLKVWENMVLPMAYHFGARPEDFEGMIIETYAALGKDIDYVGGLLGRLPGLIQPDERRIATVVRAILMDADLYIYDSIFGGLETGIAVRLAELLNEFHHKRPDRASVYLATDEEELRLIEEDVLIKQDERTFNIVNLKPVNRI